MPRKNSRGPDGDFLETKEGFDTVMRAAALTCLQCTDPNPEIRSHHYLKLMKERGIDILHDHLFEQFVTFREPGKRRQESVDTIVAWAGNIMSQYQGMADPQTGAKMPWWQARQWLMDNRDATAASAYNQAPDKYREHNPPPGNLKPAVQHITMHLPVEPGDDDPLAI